MGWRAETVALGGAAAEAMVRRRNGRPVEIDMAWRPGAVRAGAEIRIGGQACRVRSADNPGGRNERLRIALEPQGRAPETAAAAPGPAAPGGPPDADADRLAAVKAAIARLDPSDPDQWTADGRPSATALTGMLGWRVPAATRDRALEADDG